MSILSVISKTLVKSLLPYITANIPNTPTQHGYKIQHSTMTALHILNNTVAKGINQMASRTNNHCSNPYEQIFRHIKHTHTNQKTTTDQHSRHNHKVQRKLHQGTQSLHIQEPHIHTTSI